MAEGDVRRHLRHVGRMDMADPHRRVVPLIDNASWHAGEPVRQALADNPHLELKRLPSSGPQLSPFERFWKALRRRSTHNRLSTRWPTSGGRSGAA